MNVLREASTAVCRLYDSKWHHVQWKWTALWVLGILIVLINKPYCLYARNQGTYIFFFYTSVLKADNTCIRQAFLDNQILKFRSSLHPIESRALVKQKKKGGGGRVTLWHRDTSQHTASDTQTEPTAGSQETLKRKARGYVVTATGGRKAEEKERKGGRYRCRAERSFQRETCCGTTHTHTYMYI